MLQESLINLIESYRVDDGSIYICEEYLDYWSVTYGVATEDGNYSLSKLSEILKGKYIVEVHQETQYSDYEVKFTKVEDI